jgi:hypothetical protein
MSIANGPIAEINPRISAVRKKRRLIGIRQPPRPRALLALDADAGRFDWSCGRVS